MMKALSLLLSVLVLVSLCASLSEGGLAEHRHRAAVSQPRAVPARGSNRTIRVPLQHRIPTAEQRRRATAYRQSIKPNPALAPLGDVKTQAQLDAYLQGVKSGAYPPIRSDNPILPQKDYGDVEYVGQVAIGSPPTTFSGQQPCSSHR